MSQYRPMAPFFFLPPLGLQIYSSHHWCSALRQILGTQLLCSSLFSALLFIFTKEPSFSSSSILILGLPLGLLSTILPSITSLNSPSPRKTCPIQFFFRCTIVSTNF